MVAIAVAAGLVGAAMAFGGWKLYEIATTTAQLTDVAVRYADKFDERLARITKPDLEAGQLRGIATGQSESIRGLIRYIEVLDRGIRKFSIYAMQAAVLTIAFAVWVFRRRDALRPPPPESELAADPPSGWAEDALTKG